jgi:hypothetical protein
LVILRRKWMRKKRLVSIAVMLAVMVGMSFFVSLQAADAQRIVSNLIIDETTITETSVSFSVGFSPAAGSDKGVCWSTSASPEKETGATCESISAGTGEYTGQITGLSSSTTYYVGVYTYSGDTPVYVYKSDEGVLATFKTAGPPPQDPAVTTGAVSFASATSVTVGGTVTHNGYANISERGVWWGTMASPGAENGGTQLPEDTLGTETAFSLDITELAADTTYYVRAYATNEEGFTGYGADATFNTLPPTAESTSPTDPVNISRESATVSGTATLAAGGAAVTARGICWSENAIPEDMTEGDCTEIAAAEAGAGAFSVQITGLTEDTEYHFRAYAENLMGRTYGADAAFTTFIRGDVDHSGTVDLKDAMLVLKLLTGSLGETDKVYAGADADGDGKIGVRDLLYILTHMG